MHLPSALQQIDLQAPIREKFAVSD